jgi:hypothetical protein
MTPTLNCNSGQRIEISPQAKFSEDRRTILKALRIDGIWYDIQMDSPPGLSLEVYESIAPKIQMIWARIAEQSLAPNLKMECSYNCQTETASVFTLSNGQKREVTNRISFDVEQLKNRLRETPEIATKYFGNGDRCTVHAVMKYVSCELMNPNSTLRLVNSSEDLEDAEDYEVSGRLTTQTAKPVAAEENVTPTDKSEHSKKAHPARKVRNSKTQQAPRVPSVEAPFVEELLPAPTPTREQASERPVTSAPNSSLEGLKESVRRVILAARDAEISLAL